MQGLDIALIRELIAIAEAGQLAELTIVEGDESVTIKAAAPVPSAVWTASAAPPVSAAPARTERSAASPSATLSAPNLVHVTCPMTGIFYRSPGPGAPSFVEVGSEVEVGQTVGLVEAMKVFNEIVSEVEGRVVAISAQSEQLVQAGETLMIIERTRE